MKAELIKREGNMVSLKMTIDATEFEKGVQKAYLKERGKFGIPGFRKGKTPRKVIETQYGAGVFYEEAINLLLPEHYGKALDDLKLDVVDRPEIDIEDVDKEKGLVVTADVLVKPEVKLGDYKNIEVEKVEHTVSDEDVDAEMQKTLELNSRLVTIEDRPVADGDTVTIDYKGFIGEEQFEGGTAENHDLVIGSNQFIPGFEEQLIGAALDSEIDVNVSFPEDYHSEDLAGKAVIFKVVIKGIKTKEVPALDDEFAKDTSEFDTLAELKADTRKTLEEEAAKRTENEQKDKVVDAVVAIMEADIPDAMVVSETDNMLRDFDFQLRYQGLDLEKYVQFSGTSIDELKEQMKEDALKRVQTQLAIEAVSKEENLEVTDEDLENEYAKIAESQKSTVEKVKKMYGKDNLEYIKESILSSKTVNFLVEQAKLV